MQSPVANNKRRCKIWKIKRVDKQQSKQLGLNNYDALYPLKLILASLSTIFTITPMYTEPKEKEKSHHTQIIDNLNRD